MLRKEYPRPQFVRKEWLNLNGTWDFAFDDKNQGQKEKWFANPNFVKKIEVPFAFQTKLSGINDPSFHDIIWYHRTFKIPSEWKNKRILLHFGAVDYECIVYVNGCYATSHRGGNASFHVDITDYLTKEEEHIVVYVKDPSEDQFIPRGKQYWKETPECIWYNRTSGIWQTVWIEPVSETYIKTVKMITDIDKGVLNIEACLSKAGGTIQIEVYDHGELVSKTQNAIVNTTYQGSINVYKEDIFNSFVHNNHKVWTPENPYLYDIIFTIFEGQRIEDKVTSYFGMRKVHSEDGIIYLNNRPYYQKLVLDQGYWKDGLLTAPKDDDYILDISKAKEMGFNGCRKHQKAEDPRFLYHADQMGFIVWGEMANCANYNDTTIKKMETEWIEIIERDFNHPSIITWVPLNESWGVPFINTDKKQQEHSLALYHTIRSLDTTRFVISNDGWEMTKTDICAIHNYTHGQKDEPLKYTAFKQSLETIDGLLHFYSAGRPIYANNYQHEGAPIILTEFGGIGYKKDNTKGWGYTSVKTDDEFVEDYERIMNAVGESKVLVGFCYTQLTDVEQEINGLLTYDRIEKVDCSLIKKINDRIGSVMMKVIKK